MEASRLTDATKEPLQVITRGLQAAAATLAIANAKDAPPIEPRAATGRATTAGVATATVAVNAISAAVAEHRTQTATTLGESATEYNTEDASNSGRIARVI